MKTLAELKKNCTLLCEHKQPAFIVENETNKSRMFCDCANICKLFTDNKGTYYIYKRITDSTIQIFTNYSDAIRRYINFIENTCTN